MTTIEDRFRVRRGTAAALAAANEIPLDSEIVLESDTGLLDGTRKFKIGDGVTHWNSLPYFTVEGTGGSSGSDAALYAEAMTDTPSLYYSCNETSGTTLADSSGGGHNMTLRGSNVLGKAELLDGGGSILVPYSSAGANGARTADTAGIAVPINYDHTLMAVFADLDGATTNGRVVFELSSSGETEPANLQTRLGLVGQVGNSYMQQLWEYGAGTNVNVNGPTVAQGPVVILHARKNASTKTVDFFVNGRNTNSGSYANEPTGGSTGVWAIGNTASGATANGSVLISNCAFFASALSDARIKAHAKAAGLW